MIAALRPYLTAAIVGLLLAVPPAAYLKGRYDCSVSWRAAAARDAAAWAAKVDAAETIAEAQQAVDAAALAAFESRVEELQNDLENGSGVCFDGADADRVRDLWR